MKNPGASVFATDINYAFNEMLIRESAVYDVPGAPIAVSPTGADTKHGADKGAERPPFGKSSKKPSWG